MTSTPKVWISRALERSARYSIELNTLADDPQAAIRASRAALRGDLPDIADLPEYLFFYARPARGYKLPPAIWNSF
jgi:hypothetical protein